MVLVRLIKSFHGSIGKNHWPFFTVYIRVHYCTVSGSHSPFQDENSMGPVMMFCKHFRPIYGSVTDVTDVAAKDKKTIEIIISVNFYTNLLGRISL